MEKLYALERARDGKRVEFFSDTRNGKRTFVIREVGAKSQDSVTDDPDMLQEYRRRLIADGYLEVRP
jgi:hypothetical protein